MKIDLEWLAEHRRRLAIIGVIVALVVVGWIAYRAAGRSMSEGNIGGYYKQAELDK